MAMGSLLSALIAFVLSTMFNQTRSGGVYFRFVLLYSIIVVLLFSLIYLSGIRPIEPYAAGFVLHATVFLGILILGTEQLRTTSVVALEGLTRLSIATFVVWKITADMRNLDLRIQPSVKPSISSENAFMKIIRLLDGIIYPPQEMLRLIRILGFAILGFHLAFTGLIQIQEASASQNVNIDVFAKIAETIILLGVQAPLMMASRASISRTFTSYLERLEWTRMITASQGATIPEGYSNILKASSIKLDRIKSNGKHLWLSVISLIILRAYDNYLLQIEQKLAIKITLLLKPLGFP